MCADAEEKHLFRLRQLQLLTMVFRTLRRDMAEVFKSIHGYDDQKFSSILPSATISLIYKHERTQFKTG